MGKSLVVTDGASSLIRFIIASESGTGRHTYETVKLEMMLHHHINDTRREQSAQCTAFHDKPRFHLLLSVISDILYFC